jgi:hypothetical protein
LKISELITHLQKAQEELGDHPVFVRDHEVMAMRAQGTKDGKIYADGKMVQPEEFNSIDVELY